MYNERLGRIEKKILEISPEQLNKEGGSNCIYFTAFDDVLSLGV
ncbi:hypothetical protein [Flavobacterium sp. B17]|nr:hypothetical protein [Flavobacterium sp. B17]